MGSVRGRGPGGDVELHVPRAAVTRRRQQLPGDGMRGGGRDRVARQRREGEGGCPQTPVNPESQGGDGGRGYPLPPAAVFLGPTSTKEYSPRAKEGGGWSPPPTGEGRREVGGTPSLLEGAEAAASGPRKSRSLRDSLRTRPVPEPTFRGPLRWMDWEWVCKKMAQ